MTKESFSHDFDIIVDNVKKLTFLASHLGVITSKQKQDIDSMMIDITIYIDMNVF